MSRTLAPNVITDKKSVTEYLQCLFTIARGYLQLSITYYQNIMAHAKNPVSSKMCQLRLFTSAMAAFQFSVQFNEGLSTWAFMAVSSDMRSSGPCAATSSTKGEMDTVGIITYTGSDPDSHKYSRLFSSSKTITKCIQEGNKEVLQVIAWMTHLIIPYDKLCKGGTCQTRTHLNELIGITPCPQARGS
ncbi:hypothetical protein BU15DRAFT_62599 [Melanogaster broomeanus]|nr:hypothetical protein BU15DRAFT_62599 [Melanogaster broomeanus]